ncbi:hypothetical protein Tco_0238805, partial [Tanacetum coccineum]
PPFTHLIYPIPEDGGLGVHVTLDLDGQVKFGPDVEWLNEIDDISSMQNSLAKLHVSSQTLRKCKDRPCEETFGETFDASIVPAGTILAPKVSTWTILAIS